MKITMMLLLLSLLLSGCSREASPVPATTEAPTVATIVTEETTPPTEPEEPPLPTEAEETLPPEPAQEITREVSCLYNGSDRLATLTDGTLVTRLALDGGEALSLSSTQPIGGVYLTWYNNPTAYTLLWEGGEVHREEGYLHAYVTLPQAVTQLTLQGGGDLSELRLFTAGSVPSDVQDWQPPLEQADILAFPTHSDDDALFFGAAMSYYAIERGLGVQTCFMVEHRDIDRRHERLNGLWEMGIRNYPVIGPGTDVYATNLGSALQYHERKQEDILSWQVEQLRRFRPLVVLGHDLKGEYGHGQHMVNAHYLTQAVELAADESQYPESAAQWGTWDTPKLYLHMYEENTIYLDVETPLTADPEGRSPYEIAQDGYLHHHSQQGTGFYVSKGNGLRRFDSRCWGLYRSLVGEDLQADLLSGINAGQWRE